MRNTSSATEQSSLPDANPTFDTGFPIVNESNEDAKKVRYNGAQPGAEARKEAPNQNEETGLQKPNRTSSMKACAGCLFEPDESTTIPDSTPNYRSPSAEYHRARSSMRSLDQTGADNDEGHSPNSRYATPKTQPSRRRVWQSNDRKRLMFGSSNSSGDEADTERDPARQPREDRTVRKEIASKRSESTKKSSPAKRSTILMNSVTSSSSSDSDPNDYLKATQPRHILKPPKFDGSTSFETFWAQFENCAGFNRWTKSNKLVICEVHFRRKPDRYYGTTVRR